VTIEPSAYDYGWEMSWNWRASINPSPLSPRGRLPLWIGLRLRRSQIARLMRPRQLCRGGNNVWVPRISSKRSAWTFAAAV
jgi:hypothetical protein